ncbi:hypothetical protein [Pyrobaculum aerophilum]|uniref:hypothetical protein n=1 Tax=Pyrobaculum aerophilum TaxID=13773 RepID=UPI002FDB2F61
MSSCSPALSLLAELNREVESRQLGRVVIVGGFAVELYSGGAYRTGDFVLDTYKPEEARRVFEEIAESRGWRRVSRTYEGPSALFLDLVGYEYIGRVKICGGTAYVQSPEDAIVSSLNACVYRNSPGDCERAVAALAAQHERIVGLFSCIGREKRSIVKIKRA